MPKSLVIVESPAKARTIKKYLGKGYEVQASVGHVKDLPKSELGVDIEHNFKPKYVVIKGKSKILKEIKDSAKKVDEVLLAPDPDREGEAIAWHIAEEIRPVNKNIKRVNFEEITKKGIARGIADPKPLDPKKYASQQARRILDRLVGYQVSPLLWEKVKRGLSAGRVQSVTLRLITERESEIEAFKPEEYWTIDVEVSSGKDTFSARLQKCDGEKVEIKTEVEAKKIAGELRSVSLKIAELGTKERIRRPLPPFITSTLQQETVKRLKFSAKRAMMVAQTLYEGVDLGSFGTQGLITYMRTDSVRLASDAQVEAQKWIRANLGEKFLPKEPPIYKSKKGAQEAHEAIRPTSLELSPEKIKQHLTRDQYNLYRLIWERFLASQCNPALYLQTTVDIEAGARFVLRATGSKLLFPGFLQITQGEEEEEEKNKIPELTPSSPLKLLGVKPDQHFTEPPPRFNEASLVKALEELGIGRPSTYASILTTIQDKAYVYKVEGRIGPTELGKTIVGLLVESFPEIFDVGFTANMETNLDAIEAGEREWVETLDEFYQPFKSALAYAKEHMKDVKREQIVTEFACDKCGSAMVIKWGKMGEFLGCSTYPECKNTKEFRHDSTGKLVLIEAQERTEVCTACGSPMVEKRGKFGRFLACSKYPDCKTTKPFPLGVKCPISGCGGDLVERRTRKGKIFFSCGNYPTCTYATWYMPVPKPCPVCNHPFLVEKRTQRSVRLVCPNADCKYAEDVSA